MSKKYLLPDIAQELSKTGSLISRKGWEDFLKTFFAEMFNALVTDGSVKVKGLGTFKIITVEPRKSVNVKTGEDVIIPSHKKVSFTPDAALSQSVNKPFQHLETYVLSPNGPVDQPEVSDDDDTEDSAEVVGSTLLKGGEQIAQLLSDIVGSNENGLNNDASSQVSTPSADSQENTVVPEVEVSETIPSQTQTVVEENLVEEVSEIGNQEEVSVVQETTTITEYQNTENVEIPEQETVSVDTDSDNEDKNASNIYTIDDILSRLKSDEPTNEPSESETVNEVVSEKNETEDVKDEISDVDAETDVVGNTQTDDNSQPVGEEPVVEEEPVVDEMPKDYTIEELSEVVLGNGSEGDTKSDLPEDNDGQVKTGDDAESVPEQKAEEDVVKDTVKNEESVVVPNNEAKTKTDKTETKSAESEATDEENEVKEKRGKKLGVAILLFLAVIMITISIIWFSDREVFDKLYQKFNNDIEQTVLVESESENEDVNVNNDNEAETSDANVEDESEGVVPQESNEEETEPSIESEQETNEVKTEESSVSTQKSQEDTGKDILKGVKYDNHFKPEFVKYMVENYPEVSLATASAPTVMSLSEEYKTLTLVSESVYGHKDFWVYIYLYNYKKIKNLNGMSSRIKFLVPELDKSLVDPESEKCLELAREIKSKFCK